jgi:hypothetical protein
MIPENITHDNIIQALNEIDELGDPRDRESTEYYLEFNGRRYPPKVVISVANKFASGQQLDSSTFGGGEETNAFLSVRDFKIVNKSGKQISFSEQSEQQNEEQNYFVTKLKEYLENKFSIEVIKEKSKGPLILPSDSKVYVRGSKEAL